MNVAESVREIPKRDSGAKLLMVEGNLQIEREVIHVIVQRCLNISGLLARLTPGKGEDLPLLTLSRPDEKSGTPFPNKSIQGKANEIKQANIFPEARNFK